MKRILIVAFMFIVIILFVGCKEKVVLDTPVIFMSRADHEAGELYLLKDGNIERLTNNDRHENNPAFSFDKTKVTFHAGEESNPLTWEIYIIDLLTGEEKRITNNNVIDGHPDWSPDGEKLVFSSFINKDGNPTGTADIYSITLEDMKMVQLTDSPEEDNDAEWSPDGTKIVYKSTEYTKTSGREEIFVMNADGTNKTRLTETTEWQSDHDPSWSNDSKSITFERFEGLRPWYDIANQEVLLNSLNELTPWNIYTVDLIGNIKQLTWTVNEEINFLPVYYGRDIMFINISFIEQNESIIGAYHRFYLMNEDGSNIRKLMEDNSHTYTLEYFDW